MDDDTFDTLWDGYEDWLDNIKSQLVKEYWEC